MLRSLGVHRTFDIRCARVTGSQSIAVPPLPQVKAVNGSSILRLLKGLGLAPEIPEDLYHLIKKAVSMRKHLELFRKDKDGKFRLILVESRIHRLARYYRVSARARSAL